MVWPSARCSAVILRCSGPWLMVPGDKIVKERIIWLKWISWVDSPAADWSLNFFGWLHLVMPGREEVKVCEVEGVVWWMVVGVEVGVEDGGWCGGWCSGLVSLRWYWPLGSACSFARSSQWYKHTHMLVFFFFFFFFFLWLVICSSLSH